MAECNTCGGYLSIEDKIRLSMKCDANGNVVWQGALLNPELEVENYITGLTTALSPKFQYTINTLVKDLKSGLEIANLSDFFDTIRILANETEEAALKCLITGVSAIPYNSPEFTQYKGFRGNRTSMYIDTLYQAPNGLGNYNQNDGTYGWMADDLNPNANVQTEYGARDGTSSRRSFCAILYSNSTSLLNINQASSTSLDDNSIEPGGFFIATRTASETSRLLRNGVQIITGDKTSDGLTQSKWYILACNYGDNSRFNYSNKRVRLVFNCKGVTDEQETVIRNAFIKFISKVDPDIE